MMEERRLSVLGVCEVRYRGEGVKKLHHDYVMIYKGRENENRHGVAIIMRPELYRRTVETLLVSERIIAVTLKEEGETLSLVQVYAPHQGRPEEEKVAFRDCLQQVIDRVRGERKIVMGDLNAHVGRRRDGEERVMGVHGIGERNAEGECLIDLAMRNNMTIMNTIFEHEDSKKWTWYRWSREEQRYTEKSMIDMMMTNDRRIFEDVRSIPTISMDSDHRLVLGKVRWKGKEKLRKRERNRYCLERLKEEEVRERFNRSVELESEREIEGTVEESWEIFRREVERISDEIIGKKRVGGGRRKRTAWWNDEVKAAVKLKNKKYRNWMKIRTENNRNEYVNARNMAEEIKRRAKNESWIKLGGELREDMNGNRKLIYGMAKAMRGNKEPENFVIRSKEGEPLLEEGEVADRWREYFEELLNVEEEEEYAPMEGGRRGRLGGEERIDENEVRRAISSLKNGKSPGCDGLNNELYKTGEGMVKWLTKIFNKIWRENKIPSEWRKAIICPIYKKGDRRECGNYRGITLLNGASKIYERILEGRLRGCVEEKLGKWQHGFRPGKSTTDLIFYMKMLIEKNIEWGKKMYVAFIDLEKAFDRVSRDRLWSVMRDPIYEIPEKLVRAVVSMYEEPTNMVRGGAGEERWFEVRTGVRQGSVLSPLLFAVYLDSCLKRICVRDGEVHTLVYADDAAIVTSSVECLQEEMNRWNEVLTSMGMKINKGKTEVMMIGRERERKWRYI